MQPRIELGDPLAGLQYRNRTQVTAGVGPFEHQREAARVGAVEPDGARPVPGAQREVLVLGLPVRPAHLEPAARPSAVRDRNHDRTVSRQGRPSGVSSHSLSRVRTKAGSPANQSAQWAWLAARPGRPPGSPRSSIARARSALMVLSSASPAARRSSSTVGPHLEPCAPAPYARKRAGLVRPAVGARRAPGRAGCGRAVPVGADRLDPAVLEHQDLVGIDHGGQPVRDDHQGAWSADLGNSDRLPQRLLVAAVQAGGRLVQQQQPRRRQQRPGDGQPLPLAAGQQDAVLTDLGVRGPAGRGAGCR